MLRPKLRTHDRADGGGGLAGISHASAGGLV